MQNSVCSFSFVQGFLIFVTSMPFFNGSTALCGPCPLFQFPNLHTGCRTPWTMMSPSQGLYLYTGQHKHRINAYTNILASSRIRTYDPSVRANEDSSCLRQLGYRDRRLVRLPSSYFVSKTNVGFISSFSICFRKLIIKK
jgi:hypothetical protein